MCQGESVRIISATFPEPKPVNELMVELANGAIAKTYESQKLLLPDEMY